MRLGGGVDCLLGNPIPATLNPETRRRQTLAKFKGALECGYRTIPEVL